MNSNNTNYDGVACCTPLLHDLDDKNFEFDPVNKRIAGFVANMNTMNIEGKIEKRVIWYCPYCGAKLPDLSLTYYDALEEAVGKEFCDITEDEIPEEFKTDEWWKKRGL